MLAQDRTEFERQVGQLCAAYNVPTGEKCEAYWQAFNRLGLLEFARMVEHALGPNGPERMPTVRVLWDIRKMQRNQQPEVSREKPGHGDGLHGFAQRAMFQWLWRRVLDKGPLPEPVLQRVIAAKNDELAMFRLLFEDHDPEATPERFIDRFEKRADEIVLLEAA